MNLETIKTQALAEMQTKIQSVLKGKLKSVSLPLVRPDDVDTYIESLGGSRIEIDTNGWQCDYSIEFEYAGQFYVLEGDMYYNWSAQFYLDI